MTRYTSINADFTCIHCGNYVSAGYLLAGVKNRNHCPYCLWSRHLDLFEAGDRLAACKAPMQPIGLTLKRKQKRYAAKTSGELMLIHLCTACERISINRIAADDLSPVLLEILSDSFNLTAPTRWRIQQSGVTLVEEVDRELVNQQLYGESYQPA